jgi:hypothetical protein
MTAITIKVPATYDTHRALPVGVVVELADSTEMGGYWNGHRWVKTSPSTWAIVHPTSTASQIAEMVKGRDNNVSPAPNHTGNWVLIDPQNAVTLMVEKLASLAAAADTWSRGSGRYQRRLNDIESFVANPGEWQRVPDKDAS